MKYLIYIFIAHITVIRSAFADLTREDLQGALIPEKTIISSQRAGEQGEGLVDGILAFARDSIFALMALIAIAMFLYIGARLVVARGNPEEFKKAMTSFVYAAVGIFTVAAALAIVRFIAGVSL